MSDKPQTNQQPTSPAPTDKIYTMPMEYYLGEKTLSSARASQPVKIAMAGAKAPVGAVKPGGLKKWLLWIVLGLVVAGSAVLLVISMLPSSAPVAPIIPEQVPQQPAEKPNVPVIEENATTQETNATTENDAPEFNPANIKSLSLSLVAVVDRDKDGLTDAEEIIFTTDSNLKDTDADGYIDGEETANFYSPVDRGATRLWDKSFVSWYANSVYGYKFLYPSGWLVKPVNSENPSELMLMSDKNEFINILQDKKATGQTLDDWYLEQAIGVRSQDLKHYETYNKIPVLESPDGFTVYFSQGDTIYIINYNIGIAEEANYPAIFSMVVNSFQFAQ